jgi:capsular polysaccharide export protein
VDSRGIYFDPTTQSDLEYILQTYEFDEELLQRARNLKNYLIENKLSKYNIHQDKDLSFDTHKKIVLVIGQVEDDASIKYGGDGMSNLELIQKVYEKKSDEYIIYKPHPDVEAGNRKGKIDRDIVLGYVDEIVDDVSLPSLLDVCDEVHTITSLSGFEALLREKRVYTYGMPFYASWGLTIDEKECGRRDRRISLLELIAATYILYPRYISPITGKFCEVEVLVFELDRLKSRYNSDSLYRYFIDSRNYISRKTQLLIAFILR